MQPEKQQPTNQQARYQCTQGEVGGCITWKDGGQHIPLINTAQLLTLQQYTRQPHTTNTHGREEGSSNTPTGWCHCVPTSSHPHSNQKNHHICKEEMDTLPNLRQNKRGPHNPDHNMERGGGGGRIARHSRGVCAVFVFDLLAHPPTPVISCAVCCVVHEPMLKCVCGGGRYICLCMSQVCWFLLLYVYYPSTPPPLWCPLDATHA